MRPNKKQQDRVVSSFSIYGVIAAAVLYISISFLVLLSVGQFIEQLAGESERERSRRGGMAVQAQYPYPYPRSSALSPDFRSRAHTDAFQDQLQMLGGHGPMSELTNGSGRRKRSRGGDPSMALPHRLQQTVATGPSISGRLAGAAQDLAALACHQGLEVDALIRFQMERLQSGVLEATKRHCGALVLAAEQRLKDKETELQNATRRNAELEERVRQLSAENQAWFNAAKNSEAFASNLRAALAHLLQQAAPAPPAAAGVSAPAAEGYGESDARSRCSGGVQDEARRESEELRRRRACRGCGEGEASVLALPCRHLCLCRDCEPKLDTCPACKAAKNACINVCMS